MPSGLYPANTSTAEKKIRKKQPNDSQYISQKIHNIEDITSKPAEEVKIGNTIFIVTREYSKTSNVTLKQRLEQTIFDRVVDMKWSETPLDNPPTPSEDSMDA